MKSHSLSLNFFVIAMMLFVWSVNAQNDSEEVNVEVKESDITNSFDDLVKSSSTWETFKVIPIVKVNAFRTELKDSTRQAQNQIQDLTESLAEQKVAVDSAIAKIAMLETSLEESEKTNNEIGFMGFSFSKAGYHLFVWLIISALATIIFIVYALYIRSNQLTKQYRKDLEQVREELEDQRSKAHENQVKLKRELQTMMNLMSEKGVKF